MKSVYVLLVTLMVLACADALGDERDAKQAELDAACEVARQQKIKVERPKHIEECVETKRLDNREACESYYADYGETPAGVAPLFYDLPECEAAHEFRNSYRNSGR